MKRQDLLRLPLAERAAYELKRLERAARLVKDGTLCGQFQWLVTRVRTLVKEGQFSPAIHAARCRL